MIQMWTVRYVSREGGREYATVYAYPSGGVGIWASEPELITALGGYRTLVDGISAGESETLAERLTDVIAHLSGGTVETYSIDDSTDERI